MPSLRWAQDRAQLRREVSSRSYQDLLHRLHSEGSLKSFDTWLEVVDFMHDPSRSDELKDEALRTLFRRQREHEDRRCQTILLLIFWPSLKSIFERKRGWDSDIEELWQAITSVFLERVDQLDERQRPTGIARKLFNDTIHHLHKVYERRWHTADNETTAPAAPETLGGEESVELLRVELADLRRSIIDRLHRELPPGPNREDDVALIVGTRLAGRSVREYADETGQSYAVLRKRRQRAEASLETPGSEDLLRRVKTWGQGWE
ncbi:MAG: hypothetical protein R6V58_14360 [Planctomycetota bacterium]